MKKKAIKFIMALALVAGAGMAVMLPTFKAEACTECDTRNASRKCAECNSSRLFDDKNWIADNGKSRTLWKCKDCGHSFITERRNGKEVVLKEDEL